jgi:uncharacterized protein YdeI (YjbR/CyaY-like superfamily)
VSALDEAPHVQADDRAAWRTWLAANHATSNGAWLVTWKPCSGRGSLDNEAAVMEALCFCWVDSTGGRVDEERGKLYFAPRKPRSAWSASNKARVERLIAEGLMTPRGLDAIERAKGNGDWEILDSVERLEVPDDLAAELGKRAPAASNFDAFPASARKQMLAWVATARRAETRAVRIDAVAAAAAQNQRARG